MRLFLFFLIVLLLATRSVQDPKSRVIGVALDENDAVVIGVTVQLKSGNVKYRAKTDGNGRFEIELPPGCYELTAEHESFRTFRISSFQVRPNTAELVNIHLQVAPPRQPLRVQGLPTLSLGALQPIEVVLAYTHALSIEMEEDCRRRSEFYALSVVSSGETGASRGAAIEAD